MNLDDRRFGELLAEKNGFFVAFTDGFELEEKKNMEAESPGERSEAVMAWRGYPAAYGISAQLPQMKI